MDLKISAKNTRYIHTAWLLQLTRHWAVSQVHRRLALKADEVEAKIGVYDRELTQKHHEITKMTV